MMENDEAKASLPLQLSAGLVAIAAAAIVLVIWFKLKVWSLDLLSWVSFGFMPLALGLAAGLAVRFCTHQGSFGLAGFVSGLTVVAGLAGAAMQHHVEVEHRLRRFAAAAYDETFAYAAATADISDDCALRKVFTNSEVAVIGRLAHRAQPRSYERYWRVRNLFHLHWIASRQIIIYGQSDADHTIWEATQIKDGGPFLHQVVSALAKKPVTDEDLARFKEWEQPFLQRLAANSINRGEFEAGVVEMGRRALSWNLVAFNGLGPFVGLFTVIGALTGFKLVRRESETEMI